MAAKRDKPIPGYTGKIQKNAPAAPYDAYKDDLAAISTALNSNFSGPAVYATAKLSSTQQTMLNTSAAWDAGIPLDRTHHTFDSAEKRLVEAELQRRNLERTQREGLAGKETSK
eukprot:m.222334 g.222334  ORF g.222334 m.222334 type:complete len:114 (+) comp10741_c0_seq1:70-411(+)